jgi:tetratricopeptide (TPR) repeat protein
MVSNRAMRLPHPLLATLALLVVAAPAPAQFVPTPLTLLTTAKTVVVRHRAGRDSQLVIRAKLDGRALPLRAPGCPAESAIELSAGFPPFGFESGGVVPLPCDGWSATRKGHRFRAAAPGPSGVTEIVYGPKKLVIKASGDAVAFLAGPVAFLQAWLTIGDERFLLRFHNFKRNEAARIAARRPTKPAAAGEAAFWDTVWADDPREDEALALLEKAVRKQKKDGRSRFLLGMLHLYGLQDSDPFAPTADELRKMEAAQEHLDAAVELLPNDPRIAGFRAGLTYASGVAHGDEALKTLGRERIEAAVAADVLFNSFDYFAIASAFDDVRGDDPFWQSRFVDLADVVLMDNLDCPTTRPETCGNVGMAPHNVEGTFFLLGDIYAKGGRPADAEAWWSAAKALGDAVGYAHLGLADERLGQGAARAALYADDDPTNDPPIVAAGIGYCRYCHNK